MEFFESQSSAKRNSSIVLLIALLAFILGFLVLSWVVGSIANIIGFFVSDANTFVIKVALSGLLACVIIVGSFRRWQDVAAGGHQIAQRIGAEHIIRQSASRQDKALLNTVDEMAIAAGATTPDCYCMRNETAINAFVAGNKKNTALVVTQGALDKLSEAELRSVVAHEFGHITNNDLTINMRLLVVLGGLNALDESGTACYESIGKLGRKSHANSVDESVIGGMLLVITGTILCVLGSVFVFCGDILKSAYSRRRELLADAKSVQFTRDSWSLASALNKISVTDANRGLNSRYAGEIAHLCIDSPKTNFLFPKLLATHPETSKRINIIDQHFDIKHRNRQKIAKRKAAPASTTANAPAFKATVTPDTSPITNHRPISDFANELSIVFSLMIETAGYNEDNSRKTYENCIQCYTKQKLPMRSATEAGITEKFEAALDTLLQQPAAQRQALLDHVGEMMELDNIRTKDEKEMWQYINSRLNPAQNTADKAA